MLYGPDLSYIHHTGFGAFADEAASGLLAYFAAERLDGGYVNRWTTPTN